MSNNIDYESEYSVDQNDELEDTYSEEYGNLIVKTKFRKANGKKRYTTYFQNQLGYSERHAFGLIEDRYTRTQWLENSELGELPQVPLFCQPAIEACDKDTVIFVCEGEADAKELQSLGLVATTNFDGAEKWQERYTAALEGRHVVLMQDEDDSGVKHCLKAVQELYERSASVKIIRLPDLPWKGDVRNWVYCQREDGLNDREIEKALLKIVTRTQRWEPVVVMDGKLVENLDRAERELPARLAGVYMRGGQLVRAVKTEAAAFRDRKTTVVKLVPLSADSLREVMGRHMVFKKPIKVKEKVEDGSVTTVTAYMPTNPPMDVARGLLAPGRSSTMPEVAGVISCPTLRPDGSILDQPGYDVRTGLLVVDPLKLPDDMPLHPSKHDAQAALQKLEELLAEFPFKTEADRSAGLSLLMTPVLRPTMEAAPMHVVSANGAGVGKSFIVDVGSGILSGERAPVTASGWSLEEMEKRLTGPLLDGASFITLDNLDKFPIAGDFLCQAVERPRLSLRALGTTGNREIINRSFICATGINVVIKGDMLRRCLLVTLDTDEERPELRRFGFDPLQMVLKGRASYVAAILTIVRAYILAGRPGKCDALASFGQWSDNVRSALVWLGKTDPLVTMKEARKGDDTLNIFAEFVDSWWACSGVEPETGKLRSVDLMSEYRNDYEINRENLSKEDLAKFDRNARFTEALQAFGSNTRDQLTKFSLGKALQKHQNAVVNGMKLVSTYDTNRHVHEWQIKRVAQKTGDSGLARAA